MKDSSFPVGKLPPRVLAEMLSKALSKDPRVIQGPGIGVDCAVIDTGEQLLVLKSDPITFATDEIGWYLVQINANDIATAGATPRWLMVTALLPEGAADEGFIQSLSRQLYRACEAIGVTVIGGHTEITAGIERPILVGTMIGEVSRDRLVSSHGAQPGDWVLLTKGIPIEATAILAREFKTDLRATLSHADLAEAGNFLYQPGISVLQDAQIAVQSGTVNAMHDPTEGGLFAALWELAEASGRTLIIDRDSIPVYPLAARICAILNLDPYASIASGALLLTVPDDEAAAVITALEAAGIGCTKIGHVESGAVAVRSTYSTGGKHHLLPRPERDEITRLFEA